MVSFIKENRLHEFVSIEHRGMINNGIEDTTSDEIKARAGSHENYSFSEKDGITTVDIAIDMDESYIEYMNETRPQALQKLKEICE